MMSKSKTAYQWRLELPKNLRHRFVKNTLDFQEITENEDSYWSAFKLEKPRLQKEYPTLGRCIQHSFNWAMTPEGEEFWLSIRTEASQSEISSESTIEIPNNE